MRKIILISQPTEEIIKMLDTELVSKSLKSKSFAYMPCEGDDPNNEKYMPYWKELVKKHNVKFQFIDNSKSSESSKEEFQQIVDADILMITGGNTFRLLRNLRRSGLFNAIKQFFKKKNIVFLGMSAGAIVISPNIKLARDDNGFSYGGDINDTNLDDLTALGIINFEVLPHFEPKIDLVKLEEYRQGYGNEIRTMTNDEYIILHV